MQLIDKNIYCGPALEPKEVIKFANNILNLEMGYKEFIPKFRNKEIIEATRLGMKCYHVMMSDFCAPTFDELDTALEIIQSNKDKKGIYFHCRSGKDRTGMVRAAYRVIYQDWTFEQAIDELLLLGFAKRIYYWWPYHLQTYLKGYNKRKLI